MKRWPGRLPYLAGAAALAIAIPAFGQREQAPESILPPGFGTPQPPPPTPPPAGEETVVQETEATEAPSEPSANPQIRRSASPIENAAQEDLEDMAALQMPPQPELPEHARRPTAVVGPLGLENWGLGPNAFGAAHGRLLTTLMRRLDAPLPSRWTSILLRRALLSRVPTPSFVSDVDWIAERAWLLLRMGEADAARMLVQAVDVDKFTPRMFMVAVQTALATSDPAALCPLVDPGRKTSDEPVWPLADAMCAALEGEASRASALIDQARRRSGAGGIDVLLAEKVIGAGLNTRRAVTIQWEGVDTLNAWRFGMSSATGLEIPDTLINNAGSHMRAWQARAPMVPLEQRLPSAQTAASLGVFSNASLIEMYSLIADSTDPSEMEGSVGGRLRRAYAAPTREGRMSAIEDLWEDAKTPHERHARSILTAVAAARLAPGEGLEKHAERLIASMLSAGLDRQAARWGGFVAQMGDEGDRAWALLAVSTPRPLGDIGAARVSAFASGGDEGKRRARLLLAGLAGLGRLDAASASELAEDLGVPLGRRTRWNRMLDAAARSAQPGTVALLSAVGMQTSDWGGVPPENLYHIVKALRQVGLEYEARMIAAEALSRL